MFVIAEITACAVAGGLLSLLVLAVFDPFQQATDMDLIAIVAGALVAVGINRTLRH